MTGHSRRRRPGDVYSKWRLTQGGGLARDSFYVALYQGATTAADLLQVIIITRALGLEQLGTLALATSAVLMVGQLLDLRVGVATTVVGARRMQEDSKRSAGVFQFSYLVDGGTGVVSFVVVAALAPLIGPALIGEDGTLLMILFAITLLVGTVDESSWAILRLLDRFPILMMSNMMIEILRIAAIGVGALVFESLVAVVLALVGIGSLRALVNAALAAHVFKRTTGTSLLRPALDQASDVRAEMWRTMLHTNVVSYARMAQTQLPTVLIGTLASPLQVGIYKLGMGAATLVGRLSDPAVGAILPRLARLRSEGAHDALRRLIRSVALISVPALAASAAVLIVFREPVLRLLGGDQAASSAQTVLIVGAIAHAINGGLFWSGGLLYAAGRAAFLSRLSIAATVVQVGLIVPFVMTWGVDGAAFALLVTFIMTNVIATYVSLQVLRSPPPAAGQATVT